MINRTKCENCRFEEVCENDTTIICCGCQEVELWLDEDETEYYWYEMSYRKYVGKLLDFEWSEYSDKY